MRYLVLGGMMVLCLIVGESVAAATFAELEQRVAKGDNSAMTDIEALLHDDAKNYPLQFLKARLLQQQGKTDAAITLYQQLIKQHPAQPEAYNNLASLLAKNGDLAGAQKLLEQAMKTNTSYAAVYENLSSLYVEQARDAYGKALRLDQGKKNLTLAEVSKLPGSANIELTMNKPNVVASNAVSVVAPTHTQTTVPVTKPVTTVANATPVVSKPVAVKAPVTQTDSKKPVNDSEQWVATLQGWAAAWSGKTPDIYFSYYAKDYVPPGIERSTWETQRRERIVSPQWIKIGLSEFRFKNLPGNRVRARFVQDYQSDDYHDKIRKEVVLGQTPDGWRILTERKVAVLR